MNESKKYGAITSSYDPQAISATVLAITKMVAGGAVFFGYLTVADSTTLLTSVPVFVNDALAFVPLGYAVWNSAETIFGILRKLLVAIFQNKNVAPVIQSVQPVAEVSSTPS